MHSIDTACDMSHQITSYLTVCSTAHSCRHQAFTLLTLWGRQSSYDSLRDERLNWILLSHLLIWRILCALMERYFCNTMPLQITRQPFCYSVPRAFISANARWKCGFPSQRARDAGLFFIFWIRGVILCSNVKTNPCAKHWFPRCNTAGCYRKCGHCSSFSMKYFFINTGVVF